MVDQPKKRTMQFIVGMIVVVLYEGHWLAGVIIGWLSKLHEVFYLVLCENENLLCVNKGIKKLYYVNCCIMNFIYMSITYKFAYK